MNNNSLFYLKYNYNIVMILSFDGQDSILRFYRDRKEEETWLNINNLDSYENTAILIKKV